MKRIAILGSTGSIGENTLQVIKHLPDKFQAVALSTNSSVDTLQKQIEEFHPLFVGVTDPLAAKNIKTKLVRGVRLFSGEEELLSLVCQESIDIVVLAISGAAALKPLLKAIECGKQIALANKEALVMAGPIIMKQAEQRKVGLIPVDSEQSAIWQCLQGQDPLRLKSIYLTASGGPFRNLRKNDFKDITIKKVLKHPRWKMGKKISVDSATLMNKGLEILEAMFLFGVPCEKIKVLIHPEAIVHSMVEFVDGVILAQLSATDMRIPIQYALSYPDRFSNSLPCVDFYKLNELHFEKPDFKKFPCLRLAYLAAKERGTLPSVLNAANEVSVSEFLKERLNFISIPRIIEEVMDKHRNINTPDLEDINNSDAWARKEALRIIGNLN